METTNTDTDSGFFGDLKFGDVLTAGGDIFSQILQAESTKEELKFKNQQVQQQSVLNTVEVDQQTGAVPASLQSVAALPFGFGNQPLMIGALLAGIAVLALLIKK